MPATRPPPPAVAVAPTPTGNACGLDMTGLTDITIEETHRVPASAAAAVIRATKPAASGCG